jgi:hypothetical protein
VLRPAHAAHVHSFPAFVGRFRSACFLQLPLLGAPWVRNMSQQQKGIAERAACPSIIVCRESGAAVAERSPIWQMMRVGTISEFFWALLNGTFCFFHSMISVSDSSIAPPPGGSCIGIQPTPHWIWRSGKARSALEPWFPP